MGKSSIYETPDGRFYECMNVNVTVNKPQVVSYNCSVQSMKGKSVQKNSFCNVILVTLEITFKLTSCFTEKERSNDVTQLFSK